MVNLMNTKVWTQDIFLKKINLNSYKVLSVDIFDTLLFRSCEKPEDIFGEVGIRGIERGFLTKGLDANEFKELRKMAESKARKSSQLVNSHNEIDLETIYDHIPSYLVNRKKMLELELEVEKEFCYLNPSILSLIIEAKQLGLQVVLTSDMYLSKKQLYNLLEYNGLKLQYIDELFVSSEYKGSKASGILFEKMLNKINKSSADLLHVGDNLNADIKGAERLGISSIHYNVIPSNFESAYELEHIRHNKLLPELIALRKLAGSLKGQYKEEHQFWYEFGSTILGPFFALFSEWVINIAESEKLQYIHPFMREGNFLSELLQNSVKNRGLNIEIRKLYVSRLSTYLASIEHFREDEFNRYRMMRNTTIEGLFNALGLKDKSEKFKEYYGIYLNKIAEVKPFNSKLSLKEEIINFIESDEVQEYIDKKILNQRANIQAYLEQECCGKSLTVDLGFRGTIQKSLLDILDSYKTDIKMTHLMAFGSEYILNYLIEGMDIRAFGGASGNNKEFIKCIMRSPEILEQSIMKDDGTTIGYNYNKELSRVVPIQAENCLSGEEIKKKELIQEGILRFQQLLFTLKSYKPLIVERALSKQEDAQRIVHRFIDLPSYTEAHHLGQLSHDDNFGKTMYNMICSKSNKHLVQEMSISNYLEASRYKHYFPNDYWPQGTITQIDPNYLIKRQLNSDSKNSYTNQMMSIVVQANNLELKEVIVYGGGEAGIALIQLLKQFNIRVIAVADRNAALWGSFIQDVPIMSLRSAMDIDNHCYLVGSFAFVEEIKRDIHKAYDEVYEALSTKLLIITI